MADRETLLALNAQLMSKLTAGTATDDDIKTLEAVMGLLEKEAATGSISSSVQQTATIGRWGGGADAGAGSGAGASAAAASVQIIGKRKDRGRTEVLVMQSGGGESQWQPIKSVSAVRIASQLEWIPSGSEGQKWYNRCEIEVMRAEADDEDWGGYSDNPRIAEQLRTKQSHTTQQRASTDQEAAKRIVSADPALEARKDAAAAERLAAAERAMAAREKDHSSTLQRQREEERRREEEAMRRAEDRRHQDEERRRVEEERRRKEAQRRADSYYRHDQYHWREDNHQPQLHIPGGFARGDTVASHFSLKHSGDQIKVGDIGMVLGACTVDSRDKHRRVSVDFGCNGIWDMLVSPDSEAEIYKVPDSLPQGMPGQGMAQGGGPKPPQQQGYPPPQGFSPQQQGYRPQQQGYPPPQGFSPPQQGYRPQQQGYPLQQGYPPQQGYLLQQGYPPQQGGMPPQVHSPQQQGMSPQQGYPPQLSQAQAERSAAEKAAEESAKAKAELEHRREAEYALTLKRVQEKDEMERRVAASQAQAALAKTTKLKSARRALIKAAAEERKKQPASKAAMETLQGAVGGAAAAATTTAIGIGGAMMTGATIGQAVGMMGGPVGMAIGAAVGVTIGAAIGGVGLLSTDEMSDVAAAVPTEPSEALNPEEAETNVNKAPSLSYSPTEGATENLAAASLPHTARTDRSADFLDDLKEAEAKDEARAKMKAEKVATSAAKKAGKEAAVAKKRTTSWSVTPRITLLKQAATSAATAPGRCASRPASELKISASQLRSSCTAMGLAPC